MSGTSKTMRSAIITGVLIAVMLISGSSNTITNKIQNDSCAKNREGRNVKFAHPWVQSLIMFAGELTCLGMYFIKLHFFSDKSASSDAPQSSAEDEKAPLINGSKGDETDGGNGRIKVFSWIFALPAGLDLFGTTIASVSLLFLPPSVWQLLRGSLIVFVGILSVIFLKRRLKAYHWVGMIIVVLGLAAVGVSVLADKSSSSKHTASSGQLVLGVILVLVGQMISAVQFIVEETFLTKIKCDPLQVVGMEGFFGLIFTGIALIPLYYVPAGEKPHECPIPVNYTSPTSIGTVFHDDAIDAFTQMSNPTIAVSLFFYFIGIAFYNFTGLTLTKRLSAVHRTLIDALRSLSVWVVNLFIFYCITSDYGEEWKKLSPVEVFGFVLLVLGTLIYNAIIKIPIFHYESKDEEETLKLLAGESDEHGTPTIAGSPRFTFKAKANKNK